MASFLTASAFYYETQRKWDREILWLLRRPHQRYPGYNGFRIRVV